MTATWFNGRRIFTLLIAGAGLVFTANARAADQRDEAIDNWFDFLGNLNSSGLLEPAGSHGSLGVALGAGAASYTVPDPGPVTATLLDKEEASPDQAYVVPRFWALKGSPWPIDFGFSAGGSSQRSFTQASGFVQWTAYEAFARPALSLRAGYGRLFGLEGTQVASTTLEAVASYGFLRYFTFYGAGGGASHTASLTVKRSAPLVFLLRDSEDEVTTERNWVTPNTSLGLRIAVLPPFVTVTAETQKTGDSPRSYAAKLAIGM